MEKIIQNGLDFHAGKIKVWGQFMNQHETEKIYRFPQRDFSEEERYYGLWIGMAYSTMTPCRNGYGSMKRRKFDFYSISHLYSGRGKIQLADQKEAVVQPGDCIVVTPGVVNRYGSFGDYLFLEDSVKFSGPVSDMMYKAGIIRTGVYHLGLTRVLQPIVELLAMPSIKKRLQANIILQNVLMKLYLSREEDRENSRMNDLLEMIENSLDGTWNLEKMAALCQMSKNQLRKNFIRCVGRTPKVYVDERKMHRACEYLLETSLKISEIAGKLGWEDPYHFSRRFKQVMGVSPDGYRSRMILNDASGEREPAPESGGGSSLRLEKGGENLPER